MTIDPAAARPFGRTGFTVSALTLGTSNWGPVRTGESPAQRDRRIAELADAFFAGALGVTAVDTSNIYGASQSEGHLGRALARAGGLRPGQLLQTKLDRRLSDGDFSAEQMRRSLAESLQRLGLDRVQLLYLHDPENIGFAAAMAAGGPVEALVRMRDEGLAARIGISGGPVGMLQRFVETDLFDALVTHNRLTLLDRSAEALLDAATARGLGVANAAPYGGGVLTGDPRFADSYGYRPLRPETRAALERIRRLCADAGVPLGAAALQFSVRDPRVHSTIVGVSDLARFEEAVEHARAPIPEELWPALEAARPPASAALDAG